MKIAICDDEPLCLAQVTSVAKEYAKERMEKKFIFETFSHAEDLLEAAEKTGGYDIYILDIVMPDMNGIELGKKLRDMGYGGRIIYLTSSEEYSLDAFQVKAFDYILKPINDQVFAKVMDEVSAVISEKMDTFLLIKLKDRSVKLFFNSIVYTALNRRTIQYYLADGRIIESVSLRSSFSDAMAELLADKRFVLCGASMVVNLDHITEVENEAVVFGNTYHPFLGKKNCRILRSTWSNYLFEQK